MRKQNILNKAPPTLQESFYDNQPIRPILKRFKVILVKHNWITIDVNNIFKNKIPLILRHEVLPLFCWLD